MDVLAAEAGGNPIDVLLDLLRDEEGNVMIITFLQDEKEMEEVMSSRLQMFGSDGLPLKGQKVHPRLYGTYPRVLGTYVREKELLELELAVHKMTYMPAYRLGIYDRGLLRTGMAADITVFNPHTVKDMATYEEPFAFPQGIETVIVNGQKVYHAGVDTEQRPGQMLRGNTYYTTRKDG